MASSVARDILGLDPTAADRDARLKALLEGDAAFTSRLLEAISMPGLGRRTGIERDDLLPIFGLRFVQQVAAGLVLEESGADATNTGILAAIAAQCVAGRISLPKGEEAFLSAWLNSTPAWRQAPASWGPSAELVAALDRHAGLAAEAPISGARPDLIGQVVRLGELLATMVSPYAEVGALEVMQRAARLGLAPRELMSLCADVTKHAVEWGSLLGRELRADLRMDLADRRLATALPFAVELAEVYRYLLQNAAIDAETGLPNARYFRTRLETEWAAARRRGGALSVIAVDCVGDPAAIARALRETARMQDVVCRIGDARFMLICIDTHAEYAGKAAARIQRSVVVQNARVSLGVATLDSMISSVDDLIERAQSAAMAAQAAGAGYRAWDGKQAGD